MPFTFSHPAAVLPLNYLPERWLSLTALVVGSMTPDFEYFLRMRMQSAYSHAWTGLLWFDLPLGLLLLLIYNHFIKDKLIDHLPSFLNKRFSGYKTGVNTRRSIVVITLSILIGAASHIFWDSFTHPASYIVLHSHTLRRNVIIFKHTFIFYDIVQHISTVIGAVIITGAIWQMPLGRQTMQKPIVYYWLTILITAIIVLIIRTLTGLNWHQIDDVVVNIISGLLIGLLVASVLSKNSSPASN